MGKKDKRLSEKMMIYEIANNTQQYEGDGIWNRFNVLVSINVLLLGIITLIYDKENVKILLMIISGFSILMNIWGLYSLYRLWTWHNYWKEKIAEIEALLPDDLPKLFVNRPRKLKKRYSRFRVVFLSATQPFMVFMTVLWISIFIYVCTIADNNKEVFNTNVLNCIYIEKQVSSNDKE